jgi:hypothetical protein
VAIATDKSSFLYIELYLLHQYSEIASMRSNLNREKDFSGTFFRKFLSCYECFRAAIGDFDDRQVIDLTT